MPTPRSVQIAPGLGRIPSSRTAKGGVVLIEGLLPQPFNVADSWASERPALYQLKAGDGIAGRLQIVQANLLLRERREMPTPYVALILASQPSIDKQVSTWSERSTGLFQKRREGKMMDRIECEGAVQAAARQRKLVGGAT